MYPSYKKRVADAVERVLPKCQKTDNTKGSQGIVMTVGHDSDDSNSDYSNSDDYTESTEGVPETEVRAFARHHDCIVTKEDQDLQDLLACALKETTSIEQADWLLEEAMEDTKASDSVKTILKKEYEHIIGSCFLLSYELVQLL